MTPFEQILRPWSPLAGLLLAATASAAAPAETLAGSTPASTPTVATVQDVDQVAVKLHTREVDGVLQAAVEFRVQPGWHIYDPDTGDSGGIGIPTEIVMESSEVSWSEAVFPKPKMHPLEGGKFANVHKARIYVYLAGRPSAEGLGDGLTASYSGLVCEHNGSCIQFSGDVVAEDGVKDSVWAKWPEDLEAPAGAPALATIEDQGAGAVVEAPTEAEWEKGWSDAAGLGPNVLARLVSRRSGDEVQAAFVFRVDDEWHIYHSDLGKGVDIGYPTTFAPTGGTWKEAVFPEPEAHEINPLIAPFPGAKVNIHHGDVVVYLRGTVSGPVEIATDGLCCMDDGSCIPFDGVLVSEGPGPDAIFDDFPGEEPFPAGGAGIIVGAANPDEGVRSTEPSDAGPPDSGAPLVSASTSSMDWPAFDPIEKGIGAGSTGEGESQGLGKILLLAFIAGMILNIMPCVLPVVSIKILSFVNQAGESRSRIFLLGLSFAAGIIAVFLTLGGFAAIAGLGWGEQFQKPWFQISMIGVVFAFALSLFGLFEIGVPAAVGQAAGTQKQEGLFGAFSMGIFSTLLATPCSGPFLGSTLAWSATQPAMIAFLVFAVAGLGMAFPYAILTSNPAFLKYVPKPGPWMNTFKEAMGFVLLFTVIFLLWSVDSSQLLSTIAFLIFVAIGCWIWGRFARFDHTPVQRARILGGALVAIALGFGLSYRWVPGFFEEHELWEDFDADNFARYQANGQNVFVDFTANWCATCKTNEKVVYESDEAIDLFLDKGVKVMKADETGKSEYTLMLKSLRETLGSKSIPFCAVFPADDPTRPLIFRDLVKPQDFYDVLEDLPDA